MRASTNLILAFILLLGCTLWFGWRQLHPTPAPLQVWLNGTIITADDDNSLASAIAIEAGEILAVGSEADMQSWLEQGAERVDLQGKTVLPGFIEAHGHFPGIGLYAIFADLNAAPIGEINTLEQLSTRLQSYAARTPAGKPIVGLGYDDTLLAEKRHPTRAELDAVSSDHPIYIIHVSGHMGVLNSQALVTQGISIDTPVPEGGEIQRGPTGELTGLLTETAFLPIFKKLTHLGQLDQLKVTRSAVKTYAEQGVTTVQNGLAIKQHIKGLKLASKLGLVPQRIVLWPDQLQALDWPEQAPELLQGDGNKVHVGAIKFQADGSIQGYTGHLAQPYYVIGHQHDKDYNGFPAIPRDTLVERVTRAQCAGYQTAIHGNGDATIDNILDAWEQAITRCPQADIRHVLIHAQTIRADQLARMAKLNATSGANLSPSFHIVHPWYWGDRHQAIFLGPERAARISPAQQTLDYGLRFSTHLDAPVVPVTSMLRMWAPTTRQTHGGQVLGDALTISVMQSIRAMTIDSAWQMHLDDQIGSIEVGKKADLVVLDKNPLSTDLDQLREIEILETWVGGVNIYQRP